MNLPNKLTIFRILLVPIIIILFIYPITGEINILDTTLPINQLTILVLFILASVTDFFDGKIAREKHLITTFGKFMDPIADKLLINSMIILLACIGKIHMIVPTIMICRDIIVDSIRILAIQHQVVIAASLLGKTKTVMQMVAIIAVLLNNIPFSFLNIPMDTILVWVATFVSVISGIEYFLKNRHFIMETM